MSLLPFSASSMWNAQTLYIFCQKMLQCPISQAVSLPFDTNDYTES